MIINGEYIPTPFEVVYRYGLQVNGKLGTINGTVIHHTATSNPDSTFRVLQQRGLGTHFEVDQKGIVHQYADPAKDLMYHAGDQNAYKIGIDLTGGGDMGFTSEQLRVAAQLIRLLSEQLSFPLTLRPWEQRGFSKTTAGVIAHAQSSSGVSSGKPDPSGKIDGGVGSLGGPEVWNVLRNLLA